MLKRVKACLKLGLKANNKDSEWYLDIVDCILYHKIRLLQFVYLQLTVPQIFLCKNIDVFNFYLLMSFSCRPFEQHKIKRLDFLEIFFFKYYYCYYIITNDWGPNLWALTITPICAHGYYLLITLL